MNYIFEEFLKSFSMTAIHNEAVTYNWTEKYRKMAGPIAILIIILIAGRDFMIYATLSPFLMLCAYYSFGKMEDFSVTRKSIQKEEEELGFIEEEVVIEEEAVIEEEPLTNSSVFVYGSIFMYLQLTFTDIAFTLSKDNGTDAYGIIEATTVYHEIQIMVSDGDSKYRFSLVDGNISEYDKEILDAFFRKTGKKSFVFEIP